MPGAGLGGGGVPGGVGQLLPGGGSYGGKLLNKFICVDVFKRVCAIKVLLLPPVLGIQHEGHACLPPYRLWSWCWSQTSKVW